MNINNIIIHIWVYEANTFYNKKWYNTYINVLILSLLITYKCMKKRRFNRKWNDVWKYFTCFKDPIILAYNQREVSQTNQTHTTCLHRNHHQCVSYNPPSISILIVQPLISVEILRTKRGQLLTHISKPRQLRTDCTRDGIIRTRTYITNTIHTLAI